MNACGGDAREVRTHREPTSYVKSGATRVGNYVSSRGTRIKVRVSAKADFERLKVVAVTAAGTSNTKTTTVRR